MIGRAVRRGAGIDLTTTIGSVTLPNPVMTAAGTAGHADELAAFFDLSQLGAVVVKSLSPEPWAGNPAPRVTETPAGMLNSVGLQNPGVATWVDHELPALRAAGARVVASIWGRTVADYATAAAALSAHADQLTALEVNVSCPNLEARDAMFAHDPDATAACVDAALVAGVPVWAKLSLNAGDVLPVAEAASEAGAEALTVANTLLGLRLDVMGRRPVLGNGGGGLSGPAIRPVTVRAVHELHQRRPDLPVIGVGGIASADDALEYAVAGACAVQVGTATFADPRNPHRIARRLPAALARARARSWRELVGAAHRS